MEEEKIERMKQSLSFLKTKNQVKEESARGKFNRFVFETCESWALSSKSESDFNTHLEQVKNEKLSKRSTKVKWNYKMWKLN